MKENKEKSHLENDKINENVDNTELIKNTESDSPEKVQKTFLPIGLTLGIVAGIIFGELLGSTSVGMALGIGLGLLIATVVQKKLNS